MLSLPPPSVIIPRLPFLLAGIDPSQIERIGIPDPSPAQLPFVSELAMPRGWIRSLVVAHEHAQLNWRDAFVVRHPGGKIARFSLPPIFRQRLLVSSSKEAIGWWLGMSQTEIDVLPDLFSAPDNPGELKRGVLSEKREALKEHLARVFQGRLKAAIAERALLLAALTPSTLQHFAQHYMSSPRQAIIAYLDKLLDLAAEFTDPARAMRALKGMHFLQRSLPSHRPGYAAP